MTLFAILAGEIEKQRSDYERRARRNQAARDTRRLKAAGFCYVEKDCWVMMPFKVNIGRPVGIPSYTKSEALKLLEAQP